MVAQVVQENHRRWHNRRLTLMSREIPPINNSFGSPPLVRIHTHTHTRYKKWSYCWPESATLIGSRQPFLLATAKENCVKNCILMLLGKAFFLPRGLVVSCQRLWRYCWWSGGRCGPWRGHVRIPRAPTFCWRHRRPSRRLAPKQCSAPVAYHCKRQTKHI